MVISPYSIPNFIVGPLLFIFGIFVFTRNPKGLSNRVFGGLCLVSSIWQTMYGVAYSIQDEATAYLVFKFGYAGVIFIISTFGHYIYIVLGIDKKLDKYIKLTYILAAFFTLLIPTTKLFMSGVYKYFWGYYPKAGIIHPYFMAYFLGSLNVSIGIAVYYFFFKKGSLNALQRNQVKFVLSAFCIYSIACVDFIPNYHIEIYPFGYVPTLLFISTIGYTIIRYRLMDIKVAITRTAIFSGVYGLALGIPLSLFVWGKDFLLSSLGENLWFWPPLALALVLATMGPFAYNKLKSKAEALLLSKQRQYQKVLHQASEDIVKYKDEESLLTEIASLISGNVGCKFLGVYIRGKTGYVARVSKGDQALPGVIDESDKIVQIMKKDNILHHLSMDDVHVNLGLPLGSGENFRGFILLGDKKTTEVYSDDDIETIGTLLNQAFIALENIQHIHEAVEEQKEKDRLIKEMEMAKRIQESLLPQVAPEIEGLSIDGVLLPAKEVAGDYYDYIPFYAQKVGVVVADVSGKGLDSGMVMSMTKATILPLSGENLTPRQMIIKLNNFLLKQLRQQKFISMIYAEYTSGDNQFTWAGAGQERIVIRRASTNEVEVIKTGGIVLGMFEDIADKITQQSITLNKGDKLLLYTDGVTEARNPQEDMLSFNRLLDIVKAAPGSGSVTDFLNHVKDQVKQFIQDAPQYDDITLVVMGRD